MANALYGLGRNKFANGDIDWVNDTIKLYLIDTDDYAVSIDVDEFADDIASGAKVATATFAGNSTALGVCDANDTTFTSVTGDVSEALVIWKDTGTQSTSPLLVYLDTGTGLPITPNGGDITVTWDSGANKIFKL